MNKVEIECTNDFRSDECDKEEFSMIFTQRWVEIINLKVQQES